MNSPRQIERLRTGLAALGMGLGHADPCMVKPLLLRAEKLVRTGAATVEKCRNSLGNVGCERVCPAARENSLSIPVL